MLITDFVYCITQPPETYWLLEGVVGVMKLSHRGCLRAGTVSSHIFPLGLARHVRVLSLIQAGQFSFEPYNDISVHNASASSLGSCEPANTRNFTRDFTARIHKRMDV